MPITFAADFDYKSLRHVSVRSKKNRELDLLPMPTPEEVERWRNREIKTCSRKIDWQPNYEDGVAERRESERKRRDESARKRLQSNPVTLLDELSAIQVRPERPATSEQKIIAEIVQAAPQELSWSHNLYTMPAAKIVEIAGRCREALDPVFAWNLNVRLHEPSYPIVMVRNTSALYADPTRAPSNHNMHTPGIYPRKSDNALVAEWMRAAEDNRLPGRSTVCAVTGKSLVIKTNYFGNRAWRLSPAFQGMSLETAQQVASAVAVQVGLVRGTVRGTPPPIVEHLRQNAREWLGLVIATNHPLFCTVAAQLLRVGAEQLQFSEDVDKNRAEWERLSSTVNVSENLSNYR